MSPRRIKILRKGDNFVNPKSSGVHTHMMPALKREIATVVARFEKRIADVPAYLMERYQLRITPAAIYLMFRKGSEWHKKMEIIREEYLREIGQVAGAHKRVRVERMDKVQTTAIEKDDFSAAVSANKELRSEMEPIEHSNSTFIQQNNQFNFHVLNDEELEAKRVEVMKKIQQLEHKGAPNGPSRPPEEDSRE